MVASDLLEEWKNFKVTSKEEEIAIDVDSSTMAGSQLHFSLIGKLFIKRAITCNVISNTMRSAWNLGKEDFTVKNIGWNIFLFTFKRSQIRNRIFRTRPWTFDKNVLVLIKPLYMTKASDLEFNKLAIWVHFYDLPLVCMNKTMATRLGNAIGSFEEVEHDDSNFCWGPSLRVRVTLDISKPLRWGVKIKR